MSAIAGLTWAHRPLGAQEHVFLTDKIVLQMIDCLVSCDPATHEIEGYFNEFSTTRNDMGQAEERAAHKTLFPVIFLTVYTQSTAGM